MSEESKYSRGKIYKLTVDGSDLVYYGSTIKPYLSNHLGSHHQNYKQFILGKRSSTTSCQLFEIGKPVISLVEDFPCERKEQLLARERWYIENNVCVNKAIPTRTRNEWVVANKEKMKAREKEWRDTHKEYIKEMDKQYQEKNKDMIKERNKKYREKNKEHYKEYFKDYYLRKKAENNNSV